MQSGLFKDEINAICHQLSGIERQVEKMPPEESVKGFLRLLSIPYLKYLWSTTPQMLSYSLVPTDRMH